jgi:hypothetical protein
MRLATTAKVRLDPGKAGRFRVLAQSTGVLTASCPRFSVAKRGRRADLAPQRPAIRRVSDEIPAYRLANFTRTLTMPRKTALLKRQAGTLPPERGSAAAEKVQATLGTA